jgi:hypothetical protein
MGTVLLPHPSSKYGGIVDLDEGMGYFFCGNFVRKSINLGELIERGERLIRRGKWLIEHEMVERAWEMVDRAWETVYKLQIMVVTSPKLVGGIIYKKKKL